MSTSEEAEAEPLPQAPARLVVGAHLRDHAERLRRLDPEVRRDSPDAVHAMRVSTRRLRSALASFGPLLDRQRSRDLREELRWLAGVLGGARDAEVMRDRLTAMAAEDAARNASQTDPTGRGGQVGGGVSAEIATKLENRHRAAHGEVVQALDGARYARLLDSLQSLASDPPWTSAAEAEAHEALPPLVGRDWQRVKKHATAVDRAEDPGQRDHELHEVRKAAKRLRYACEALAPVFGAPAAELGGAAKSLQEVLGEHQDSIVSRDLLRELSERDGLTDGATRTLERLERIESQHADRARDRYGAAWEQVSDKRHRRWLTS